MSQRFTVLLQICWIQKKCDFKKLFLCGRLWAGGLSRPHRGGHRCRHRGLALAGQPAAGGAACVWRLIGVAALGRHSCTLLRRVRVDPHRGSSEFQSIVLAHRSVFLFSSCPCSSKKELSRWRVVSGRTYMGTLGGSYVDRIILNGEYDPERNDYDIALMRLSSPITLGGKRSQHPLEHEKGV